MENPTIPKEGTAKESKYACGLRFAEASVMQTWRRRSVNALIKPRSDLEVAVGLISA
jgi:hypothetical protein